VEHPGSAAHRHVRPRRRDGARLALAAAAAVGATAFLAGRLGARQEQQPPHAALLTGEYWASLAPRERQAYLTGFLSGAAAEQARARAAASGAEGDSAAVSSGAIAALRAGRQLHFRFAPPVYSAQVDDFYWWKNHAPVPVVDAMIHINREMLKQQTPSTP
jgi:hypothetical protein